MELRSASASAVLTGVVVRRGGWLGTCPRDVAAEQSVLSGWLLSKDAIADVLERCGPCPRIKATNNKPNLWPFRIDTKRYWR